MHKNCVNASISFFFCLFAVSWLVVVVVVSLSLKWNNKNTTKRGLKMKVSRSKKLCHIALNNVREVNIKKMCKH